MSLVGFDGLWWLLLTLGPLLLIQRGLHREIQAVFMLVTRRPAASILLFSVLFFPGVFLHEASHYLMAFLLRVPRGRFSLIPHAIPGGKLQLGYVETAQTDVLRETLIGVAPLLSGGALVGWMGASQLGMGKLGELISQGNWAGFWTEIQAMPQMPDFWLWFYILFVVSSTMLPSASDRRGWLPVVLILAGLLGVAILFGAGEWMAQNLAPRLNVGLRGIAVVFGISLGVHALLYLPVLAVRMLLNRITGLQVE